jgi:tRNA U38,U39,U40 pseudouridine synthase TruA
MNEAAQRLLGIHDFSAFVPNALEGNEFDGLTALCAGATETW